MRRLSVARAVENVLHVVCVNQAGTIGELRFPGGSRALDPLGAVALELGAGDELAVADLDMGLVARLRDPADGRTYPLLADRRPDLYGGLLGLDAAQRESWH
jgi:predicted amidohydrolase